MVGVSERESIKITRIFQRTNYKLNRIINIPVQYIAVAYKFQFYAKILCCRVFHAYHRNVFEVTKNRLVDMAYRFVSSLYISSEFSNLAVI